MLAALPGRIRARAETGPSEAEAMALLESQTALRRLATADEVVELSSGLLDEHAARASALSPATTATLMMRDFDAMVLRFLLLGFSACCGGV